MANLEKHKRNLILDWIDEEEGTVTAQARSRRVVGASAKGLAAKRLPPGPVQPPPRPDPALAREPAPAPRLDAKPSQANSPDHLRKLQRLPKLRAPMTYKSANPAPRAPALKTARATVRRRATR